MVVASYVGSEGRLVGRSRCKVNIAARIKFVANPGAILMSGEIAKRTRGKFECAPAERLALKGKEQSMEVWELLSKIEDKTAGHLPWPVVPIIGREKEIHQVVRQLQFKDWSQTSNSC